MRKLFLFRHSKSSWKYPELDDHERPLNKRGKRDSLFMARHFADKLETLDVIYSSSAIRALEYAELISEFTQVGLVPELTFYTFDDDQFLQALQELPDEATSVAVVGHNPAITRVVNRLAEGDIINVPTSAVVSINCDIAEWAELADGVGRIEYYEYPKLFI